MSSKRPTAICFVVVVQVAVGTVLPLEGAVDHNRLVLTETSFSQRTAVVAETQTLEPLPEFDPDNPQAIGIILAFRRWPDEEEQTLILEKTMEAGLTKTKEIPSFKVWLFEWSTWRKAATAQRVCHSLPVLSSVEYCEPDILLRADDAHGNCRLFPPGNIVSRLWTWPRYIGSITDAVGCGLSVCPRYRTGWRRWMR